LVFAAFGSVEGKPTARKTDRSENRPPKLRQAAGQATANARTQKYSLNITNVVSALIAKIKLM
jgi:hypothetical protein